MVYPLTVLVKGDKLETILANCAFPKKNNLGSKRLSEYKSPVKSFTNWKHSQQIIRNKAKNKNNV